MTFDVFSIVIGILLGYLLFYFSSKHSVRKYKQLAYTDSLTCIPNSRAFDMHFNKYWNTFISQKKGFTLVLIDIDNFKSINDKYTYETGDIIIKEFSKFLKLNIRANDLLFRYKQGDEFALLLNTDQETSVNILINRLISNCKRNIIKANDKEFILEFGSFFTSTSDNYNNKKKSLLINDTEQGLLSIKESYKKNFK